MKTVFQVSNKVFSALFETKEAAEFFMSKNATGSNGLYITPVSLLENTDMEKGKGSPNE